MKCPKCGKTVSDEAKFCPSCGTAIVHDQTQGRMQLVCRSCGNIMTPDDDNQILFCPACGSKELILESPDVTIQRIKSKTEKEIELEKLKHEEKRRLHEMEKEQKEKESQESAKYKKSKLAFFSLLFFFVCLIITIVQFRNGFSLQGVIALAQTVLFAASWLIGMRIVKVKTNSLHIVTAILGFALIVPFIMLGGGGTTTPKTFEWQKTGLCTMIPEPKSNVGSLKEYSWGKLEVRVLKTTKEDYDEYKQACIEKGFINEVSDSLSDYKVYNNEGYGVTLSYNKSNERMDITVETPKAIGEYKWPKSTIANLIPQYESKVGKISTDSSSRFQIYIGDVSMEDFNSYIDKCAESGFDVDYERHEKSYRAKNKDGYDLYIYYEDYRTMQISISEPDEEKAKETEQNGTDSSISENDESKDNLKTESTEKSKEETPTAATEKTSEKASGTGTSSNTTGVRKEVKEAIDGYEAFFKEYVDFMEKYSKSGNEISMLKDYTSMMIKYEKNVKKWESFEKDYTMNDAELKYYTAATLRIEKMLLTVSY